MALLETLLGQRRLIITLFLLLAVTGLLSWTTMVRQEDPRLPEFWGQIVIPFPGATAEQVERLVLDPVEDHLAEVDEIRWTEATAFAEMAVLFIELREDVDDTTRAWDEIREALADARPELPDGALEPTLNDEAAGEQESVVLALTGSPDPLELLTAARQLKDRLLTLPQVALVHLVADPGEQVTVELDAPAIERLNLSPPQLAAQLGARSRIVPGGSLRLGSKTVSLRPNSDFSSLDEIRMTPVLLPSGQSVPLSEVAAVRLGPTEPAPSRMRFNGEMAVGLGVVAKKGSDLVRFGDQLRSLVDGTRPRLQPLQVHEVAFQPRRVSGRIDQLSRSLLLGIVIVAGVVVLAMGLRLGLLVASVVPLVAMASLAVYAFGGGVLHQMSIAALVLALGMLVDNAIVMAENVQWRLEQGETPRAASVAAVRELALPLGAATATTIAAFVPMLLAQGGTAEFTRAIPVVIMLTLGISYFFAVLFTPVVAERVLRPGEARSAAVTRSFGRRIAMVAVGRPWLVLSLAALVVGASMGASSLVRRQFFPAADRNQVVVDIKLPEGSHLDATDDAARVLEKALLMRDDVVLTAAFIGRSTPKFYYNLNRVPWSPHFAQVVVETRSTHDVPAVIQATRELAARELRGIEVIPRQLEQGPPVNAPVELRLFGDSFENLHLAASTVAAALAEVPGTENIRHDLSPGAPTLRVVVDDAAAARHGLDRAAVAGALYGHTRGLPVGDLSTGEDPIPVVVRSSAGENTAPGDLTSLEVARPGGGTVPLGQVAKIETLWQPAAIKHRDRQRLVTVSSQLAGSATFSDVLAAFAPRLAELELPDGVSVAYGGDAEGSGEANSAMLRTLPIGLMLLLGVLLAEFNSFRRVAIVLTTVPLAAAGVIPGLLLGNQPFGFMSMLGVIALVGIVVNNAIVLLEVVESQRAAGASIDNALATAIELRIRPILLTTATTVAGLLPLALSSSTLWPPLASAMISGLLASTMLTLAVVPSLYRVLFRDAGAEPVRRGRLLQEAAALTLAIVCLAPQPGVHAADLDLDEAMRLAMQRPAAEAATLQAAAAAEAGRAERRVATLPMLGASFSASDRNRELELETPLGAFAMGSSRANSAGIELAQPLFDPARLLYANPATRHETEAAQLDAARFRQRLAAAAGESFLQVHEQEARLASTRAYVASLASQLTEMEARVEAGRALEADVLKLRLAMERAELEETGLVEGHRVALRRLAQSIGRDGLAALDSAPDWVARPVPATEDLVAQALEERRDLRAVRQTAEALELRRSAVRAEALPRLEARLNWSWSDGSPYTEEQWAEGALTVSWNAFAAGTRGPRAAAISARRRAAERQLEELGRSIRLELESARAELVTAREAVAVGERGVEQATENLRVERERHAAGRATTNDLLIAEAELREQRTLRDLARLRVVRAWIGLWLATGSNDVSHLSIAS